MANAFSPGRVSLWHTSLDSFKPNGPAYKDLGVTDVFFDIDKATKADMDFIKGQASGDGKNFRAQLYLARTDKFDATTVNYALEKIAALKSGVLEIDYEPGDDNALAAGVTSFFTEFRQWGTWRMNFPLCFNVTPMKGYVLPIAQMAADSNCYIRVQRYYGEQMRGAEAALLRDDIVGRGFPAERFSFMESAKARRWQDGELVCDLPIFGDNGQKVRNLSGGAIYNANELRNAGLV